MLACWLIWTSHIYALPDELWQFTTTLPPLPRGNPTSNSMWSLFSACPSSLLLRGAHNQELPRYGPRCPAQRAPRGRTHCRSVPGCHVHAAPTGHSHNCQQPSAGPACRQRLKWPLPVPANTGHSHQLQLFLRKYKKFTHKLLIFLYVKVRGSPTHNLASLDLLKKNYTLRIYFVALHTMWNSLAGIEFGDVCVVKQGDTCIQLQRLGEE